jgi:hypothetical protein
MSIDCSFSGGSSRNPACANWWITGTKGEIRVNKWLNDKLSQKA